MQQRRAAVRKLAYSSVVLFAQAAMQGVAAETFEDSFAGGDTRLEWTNYPMFEGGAVQGRSVEDAPDGDGGIGVLQHEGGGLATVSYARSAKAEDSFEISAWVYCPREAEGRDGTLTGLAFYLQTDKGGSDPEEGGFYRLVCDYRFGTGSFSLAYIGANIGRQPLELERWPLLEQTAPVADDGWRRLVIDVEAGLIELYLDDVKLNERPIPAERVITDIANVDAGYAGVYAGHIGEAGTAEARVDGFTYVVRGATSP